MATVISDVRATVEALAKGLIPESKMPAPSAKTNAQHIRYAPSFIPGASCPSEGQHPSYTANTVARFLGMTKKEGKGKEAKGEADMSIVVALDALELIEQGALTEDAAIDHTTGEELGPKALAQKIQGSAMPLGLPCGVVGFCPVSSIRTNLKFLFDNAALSI